MTLWARIYLYFNRISSARFPTGTTVERCIFLRYLRASQPEESEVRSDPQIKARTVVTLVQPRDDSTISILNPYLCGDLNKSGRPCHEAPSSGGSTKPQTSVVDPFPPSFQRSLDAAPQHGAKETCFSPRGILTSVTGNRFLSWRVDSVPFVPYQTWLPCSKQ